MSTRIVQSDKTSVGGEQEIQITRGNHVSDLGPDIRFDVITHKNLPRLETCNAFLLNSQQAYDLIRALELLLKGA